MISELVALSGVTFTPPSSSAETTAPPAAGGGAARPGAGAGAPAAAPRFSERDARTLATSSASEFSR